MTPHLRNGLAADLPRLTAIYNWYVNHSDAIFDDVDASAADRERWFAAYAASGPHQLLVAEVGGAVAGYACSSPYRSHPAFAKTVETSVCLDPGARGEGLGTRLYNELLGRLAAEAVHLVVAGVALPNPASTALHLSAGFREVGTFTEYAAKGGHFISSVWFEKLLSR